MSGDVTLLPHTPTWLAYRHVYIFVGIEYNCLHTSNASYPGVIQAESLVQRDHNSNEPATCCYEQKLTGSGRKSQTSISA
jgi:hypothetical protein